MLNILEDARVLDKCSRVFIMFMCFSLEKILHEIESKPLNK